MAAHNAGAGHVFAVTFSRCKHFAEANSEVMATHDVRVETVLVLAFLATDIADEGVGVAVAANVNGEEDFIVKCDATVRAACVGTRNTLLLAVGGEGAGGDSAGRGEQLTLNATLHPQVMPSPALRAVLRRRHCH